MNNIYFNLQHLKNNWYRCEYDLEIKDVDEQLSYRLDWFESASRIKETNISIRTMNNFI